MVAALLLAAPATARRDAGPANTAPPTIVGTPRVNGSVSATTGTWTDAGAVSYSYAWEQCDPSGAACSALSYTTQTIDRLQAVVGQTIRVVVTATASDGSASATSAPVVVQGAGGGAGGGLTVSFRSPRAHAIVTTHTFKVVVQVAGASGTVRVQLGSDLGSGHPQSLSGARSTFTFTLSQRQGGAVDLDAVATAGGKRGEATETIVHQPKRAFVQNQHGGYAAPGCGTCLIRDPRGDDKGGGPDLASAATKVVGGYVTFTLTSYDAIRNSGANGGRPYIVGWMLGGPDGREFSIGGGRNDSALPAAVTYPNAHTLRYRVRGSVFKSQYISWQVWVLYPGDSLRDTIPRSVTTGNDPWNCFLITEFVRRPPGAYQFGRNSCPQTGVVTGKP